MTRLRDLIGLAILALLANIVETEIIDNRINEENLTKSQQNSDAEILLSLENSTVFLGCSVDDERIQWRLDGEPKIRTGQLFSRYNSEFLSKSGRHVLTISELSSSKDTGLWTCHRLRPEASKLGPGNVTTEGPILYTEDENAADAWNLLVLKSVLAPALFVEDEKSKVFKKKPESSVLRIKEKSSAKVLCAVVVPDNRSSRSLSWSSKTSEGSSKTSPGSSSSMSPLDVSSQFSKKVFIQNENGVVGYKNFVTLRDVERSSNGAELACAYDGGEKAAVTVHVEYPPTFTIHRVPAFGIPVVEGMTVSLTCDADVRPADYGSWLKDETRVPNAVNGTLLIDSVRYPEDAGWYQCYIVYNGVEYSSVGYFLNVQPKPEPEVLPEDQRPRHDVSGSDALSSGNVVISEEDLRDEAASSSSSSTLHASSLRTSMHEGGRNSFDLGSTNVIQVQNVEEDNNFRSVAENVVFEKPQSSGCNSSAAVLSDYRTPAVKNQNSSRTFLKRSASSFTLRFVVCSNPKADRVIWATPVYALRPGQRRVRQSTAWTASNLTRSPTNATCYAAELTVEKLSEAENFEDGDNEIFGEYVFIASNAYGMADGVTALERATVSRADVLSSRGYLSLIIMMLFVIKSCLN